MGSIDCSQTTVNAVGNDLTIKWKVSSSNPLTGPNHVYAYALDKGGLNSGPAGTTGSFTDIGTWTISTTNQTPIVVVPSPPLGLSTKTGETQIVSTKAYDPNGWGNIREVWLLVNDVNDWTNSVAAFYDSYTNLIYLRSDDASTCMHQRHLQHRRQHRIGVLALYHSNLRGDHTEEL
ncbi:hypothetical protein IAD21_01840 [Abditibacteriota bacterium]|nr:hypothetical protein IAD21_01840 [Abditibacteriota bacterium]